jgi:uncharacterized protein YecT (DUF1311 family)
MRWVLAAYALVATLAWGSGGALADDLDGWCAQIKKASSIVICSDAELRQEAIARNKLFDVARAKLNPEAYKALTKEQAQWIKAYTARCGVSTDDPPPAMPIAQSVVDCYRRESRARTAYLAAHLGLPNLATAGANPSLDYSGLKPLDYSGHPFDQFGATSGSAMAEDRGEISLVEANGVYKVPVIINNVLPLQFVLDSGSGDVSLPEDVFSVLRRTGTITSEDYIGTGNYQLADGSTVQSDRFNIRELKVGAHVLKHVSASIGDKRGPCCSGKAS